MILPFSQNNSSLRTLIALCLLFAGQNATAFCQEWSTRKLPVLQASSDTVDIRDGETLLKNYWTASPNTEIDVYYAKRFEGKKKITFRTDIDTLSFEIEPGRNYDFDIRLNKQLCHTRISTLRRSARRIKNIPYRTVDEIPFLLGSDGKIHIRGYVGNSEPLDLLFDTGADSVVLYPSAMAKKVHPTFDGVVQNTGFGGVTTRQTSSDNTVVLANLQWDHEGVLFIDKQADIADGIVGFNVFEDKIVEINYDRGVLLLRDSLPETIKQYTKVATRTQASLPQIKVTLNVGEKTVTDWLILDTGSNSALHLNHAFSETNGLYGTMTRIGTSRSSGVGEGSIENAVVSLPQLTIGNILIPSVPVDQELPVAGTFVSGSLIGMRVLHRFNTIIDYRRNQIYLQERRKSSNP